MGDEEDDEADEVAAYAAMPFFHRTPELVAIARGDKIGLTPASDIYQLGLVLYRALTGFNPQKVPGKVTDDISLDVRSISGAESGWLNRLIQKMLKDEPDERPTAKEVLQSINKVHKEVCAADMSATGMMR